MSSMEVIYVILMLLQGLIPLCGFLFLLSWSIMNHPEYTVSIKFRIIPKYKKLVSQYNAKYPCMMFYLYTLETSFHNFTGLYRANSYIFIKDESFIIISTENPDIAIQIPFKSIICQESHRDNFYDDERYNYFIDLIFKANDGVERISFFTLPYNHKLCKKYPDLLCDDQLFNFVCENFIDSDEVFNS